MSRAASVTAPVSIPKKVLFPPTPPAARSWQDVVRLNAARVVPARPRFVMDAAPTSRTVPYMRGLDYGVGLDSPSGTAMNVAVTGSPSQIPNAGGSVVMYTMNELTSEEDLQTSLGVSVEANGGIGLFSASARMDYAKSCNMNSSSVFLMVNIQVTNAFTMIKQPGITPEAAQLLAAGNTSAFQQQFGNMFVRGLQTGGQFFGVIEIKTSSQTDQQSVSAKVSAAYGPFGGSGSFSDSFKQAVSSRSTKVTCYIEGGAIPNPLPSTVDMLMQAAGTWPQSVAANAVPYSALLDGYGILPLPNPPNIIDIQQQQDVLNQCSWWRNQDLTTLNDIAYIKTNPTEFANPDQTQLANWQNQLTQDLNTIAAAASAALNSPLQAKLPTLLLPPPLSLPQRIADATPTAIRVPNLLGMYMRDADDALTRLGLTSSGSIVATTQAGSGDVFQQSPPPGVVVPPGSTVTIMIARNPNDE